MSKDRKFEFQIPIELIKSEDESVWRIKGIASTEDADLQGESVSQEGLDISALKAGRGLWNWDHAKGPENILGQIEDANFIKQDGKTALEVEGYLFQHQDKAKAVHNILKSIKKGNGPRVHMSIEGKILERDFQDPKRIKKARIDKVALTLDPVNPYTFTQLCKSLNSTEAEGVEEQVDDSTEEMVEIKKSDLEILLDVAQKAMSAGASVEAPSQKTGGEALAKESLDKKPKSMTNQQKNKKEKKVMVKSLIESLKKAHPNHDPLELAEWVIGAYIDKYEND
jgi:hypothetical protein